MTLKGISPPSLISQYPAAKREDQQAEPEPGSRHEYQRTVQAV